MGQRKGERAARGNSGEEMNISRYEPLIGAGKHAYQAGFASSDRKSDLLFLLVNRGKP